MCTVLEALAIDKLPVEIAVRDTVGQQDIARALDDASLDELYHVENGLVWTRKLCADLGLDPMIERECTAASSGSSGTCGPGTSRPTPSAPAARSRSSRGPTSTA